MTASGGGSADGGAAPSAVTQAGYALRIALFFTALFLVAGVKLPYLPVWLDWRGLSGPEIALITSAPLFLRIFAGPLIAMAADWSGDRRLAVVVLSWVSLAGLAALAVAQGFWQMLVAVIVMALASTGIMPIAETLAMSGVRLKGLDYGRMRLWGSLSFVVAGFVAGFAIQSFGAQSILWLTIGFSAVAAMVAHALPAEATDRAEDKNGKPGFSLQGAIGLFKDRRFLVFLLAAGGVQASHALFYTFGVIEWRAQGISSTWAGVLWAVGVGVEVALFAVSRRAVERVGAVGLLLIAAVAGVVRWSAMALAPPLWALLPLQALHGLTFGAAHLGGLHVLAGLVAPASAGTAQAVYASVTSGIGIGLATLLAGPLYAEHGSRAYLAMAVLAAMSVLAGLVLARLQRR